MENQTARPVNGHKVPGCTGTWISIGTYRDPNLQKCLECKGTRRSRELEDPAPALPAGADPDDPAPARPVDAVLEEVDEQAESYAPGPRTEPMPRWAMYLLVAAATAVACWGISQAP